MLENDMVTYLVREGAEARTIFSEENKQLEAYCSGIGRMLLASLPEPDREAYLAEGPFVALTERTITDPAELRAAGFFSECNIDRIFICGGSQPNHHSQLQVERAHFKYKEVHATVMRKRDLDPEDRLVRYLAPHDAKLTSMQNKLKRRATDTALFAIESGYARVRTQ